MRKITRNFRGKRRVSRLRIEQAPHLLHSVVRYRLIIVCQPFIGMTSRWLQRIGRSCWIAINLILCYYEEQEGCCLRNAHILNLSNCVDFPLCKSVYHGNLAATCEDVGPFAESESYHVHATLSSLRCRIGEVARCYYWRCYRRHVADRSGGGAVTCAGRWV
jgi:hypothetical protein